MQDAEVEAPVRKRTRSLSEASSVSAGLSTNERVAVATHELTPCSHDSRAAG